MTRFPDSGTTLRDSLAWSYGTVDDRPSCPDCDSPAKSCVGRGRWICGLCEKGFQEPDFPLGGNAQHERVTISRMLEDA